MSNGDQSPIAPPQLTDASPTRGGDAAVCASLLLTAAAPWFVLYAIWEAERTYARHRGNADLDMPDRFAINVGVLSTVAVLGAVAGFCQFVAGGLFLSWGRRVGWWLRVGFVAQWVGTLALILWLLRPWLAGGTG